MLRRAEANARVGGPAGRRCLARLAGSVRLGLGEAAGLQIEIELGRIRRATAATVELRPLLDGERHVVDVALDAR